MPKKKSGKKVQLSKMTDEERMIYLEQQRLAEDEMKKKKEEMLAQFLKNKLVKEEKTSKFNLNKLNQQWRNYMREAKSKELKKELEILSQTFERVVDRKESVIKSLGKDLLEAEEQNAMALRSHIQIVDNLIDLLTKILGQFHKEFLEEQTALVEEFDSEKRMLMERYENEMTQLQDIMYAMDQNFLEKELETKADFQSTRDEIKNRNLEEKHALRIALEAVVEDLWNQFTVALKNYQESTEERKKAFEELKAKDERSAEEIDMQMRKLQRISDNIAMVKYKMAGNSRECEERNNRLKEDREMMVMQFQQLKSQLSRLRSTEHERLIRLAQLSNGAIKELKTKISKSERILKFAEMCRGLETEEEKVLPFYTSTLSKEEQDDVDAAVAESPTEQLAKVMYEYTSLENFWKRYNKVFLDKMSLEKERYVLQEQNQQLRLLLKQYLDGISVNDEILTKENPLLIVNHKTNIKLNIPLMDKRVQRQPPGQVQTVIEAAHIAKTLVRQ